MKKDVNKSAPLSMDFKMLWAGQTLSISGDQLLLLALPLLAIEIIGASAAQATLLPFAMFAPFLLIGLQVGAIIDRIPRKKTMMVCDLVQFFVFGTVAILAMTGFLTFWLLMGLVAIGGVSVVFFQIAYSSYTPDLLSGEVDIQRGNTRLTFSESTARTLSPMIGGPMIATFGLIATVFINAATFLLSFFSLLGIKTQSKKLEPKPIVKGWMKKDIKEGLKFVFSNRNLESMLLCSLVYVFFLCMVEFSLVLYCREVLKLDITVIGFIVGATAAGLPIGNLICTKLTKIYGTSFVLVFGATVSVIGIALVPVMGHFNSIIGLIAVSVFHGIGEGAFTPTAMTIRQTVTPTELLGRVNAVQRFLVWGAIPLSSLFTSLCIKLVGLSPAMWIGGIGSILCLVPLLRKEILDDMKNLYNRKLSLDSDNN